MLDIKQVSRTIVPLIYSGIIWVLAQINFSPSGEEEEIITAGIAVVVGGFIYTIIAVLEKRFPWVGALIGGIGSPDSYSKDDDPYIASKDSVEEDEEVEEPEFLETEGIYKYSEDEEDELQEALRELNERIISLESLRLEEDDLDPSDAIDADRVPETDTLIDPDNQEKEG